MSRLTSLSHTFVLPVGAPEAFELFADPRRLDDLTPSWFRLRPRRPLPPMMRVGDRIEYTMTWRGLPIRWTSLLTEWHEPHFLVYEQAAGPYQAFRHEHRFAAVDGGTQIEDRVLFRSLGGPLIDRWLLRPELRRIFFFREAAARQRLTGQGHAPPLPDLESGATQSRP